MTGPDYDDDEPEFFRPAPHPDDRLWRHPSEMAAMQAAHANAETIKVPAVQITPPRSRINAGLLIAAGVVAVGATALTFGFVSTRSVPSGDQAAAVPVADAIGLNPAGDAAANAGGGNPGNSTTDIVVDTSGAEAGLMDRLHDNLAASLPRIQAATPTGMREGSGLFVTDEGHIATSTMLVDGSEYVVAWTEDGRRWEADIVATDGFSDVAILQIDSDEWPAMPFDSGATLRSGQYALTVDYSADTLRVGEVATVMPARVLLSESVALPGSAVVDDTGAVIGMVNGDETEHATPAWLVEDVAVDLITSGATTHTWLGIGIENSPDGKMASVVEVVDGSPADDAGLRVGDTIDTIDGKPVADAATLWRAVQMSEPDDSLVLTVTRGGNRRIIVANLSGLPD